MFEDIKSKLNPMEKKKIDRLDEERNIEWKKTNKLEKERQKLLKNLKPHNLKELTKLKQERDIVKQKIKDQIRELKERRKEINEKFRKDSKWIRDERRNNISENNDLKENMILRKESWDLIHKKAQEWHSYYRHLHKKYVKERKGEQ